MRMTYASFKQFYENVDMSKIWNIWSPWRNEKGATAAKPKWCHGNISENDATATYPKMVPRQRLGSGSSRRYRCKRSGRERVMKGWWGDPGFRVPTGWRHGKRGTCTKQTGTVQTYRTSHTCKGISSRSSRVIPLKRAFRGGSKSSREVVVHGSSSEVVVHIS